MINTVSLVSFVFLHMARRSRVSSSEFPANGRDNPEMNASFTNIDTHILHFAIVP